MDGLSHKVRLSRGGFPRPAAGFSALPLRHRGSRGAGFPAIVPAWPLAHALCTGRRRQESRHMTGRHRDSVYTSHSRHGDRRRAVRRSSSATCWECPSERRDRSRWRQQRSASAAAPAAVANEQELQGWRNILASDPKNVRANAELGNRLYDAGRYAEAIPYYQQAFTATRRTSTSAPTWRRRSTTPAVLTRRSRSSTSSLAIDPKHGQTLFNVGIVKRDGTQRSEGCDRGVGAAARLGTRTIPRRARSAR